jgi:3-hydroxyisobutyrate dehydrogenase-like beta-hydroxyacid dehydrogenase
MSADARPVIGFIGLGAMGEPMCLNLARKSGARVVCHDLRTEVLQRVAAKGVETADTIEALAAICDVSFLCLASAQATTDVARALLAHWGAAGAGRRSGKIIVDTGTTSVRTTRALAEAVRASGHTYVDAPVARMPAAAVAGTLSFMVGAAEGDLARVEPYLRCMGTDITRCGDVGSGQVVKILHNTLLFETVHAVAEALAVAEKCGVDGGTFLDAVELGSARCDAARVQGRQALLPRAYPQDRFATAYALKDVSLALELARDASVDISLAPATAALLQRTADAGFADRYYPAMLEVLRGAANDPE